MSEKVSLFEHIKLEGDFTLNSGKKSNVFYDFDLLSPHELVGAVERLIEKIGESNVEFDFVVAPAIGGIIPGWMVAGSFAKPFIIVDGAGKVRGRPVEAGKFLVVDDVVSTYGTVKRMEETLNGELAGVASFIFRGEDVDKKIFALFLERVEVEK